MKKRTNIPKKKVVGSDQTKARKMLKSHKKRSKMKKSMEATKEMTVSKKRTKAISKSQITKMIRI